LHSRCGKELEMTKNPIVFACLLASVVFACGGKTENVGIAQPEPVANKQPSKHVLHRVPADWWKAKTPCPAGSTLKGAVPPKGSETWCADSAGKKQGPATKWYENGKLFKNGWYKDGELDGLVVSFYPTGQLREQVAFAAGKQDGIARRWHLNGAKQAEAHYKAGKEDGIVRSWYENGTLRQRVRMTAGKPVGKLDEWYPNGKRKRTAFYADGKQSGPSTSWYADGKLEHKSTYVKGKIEG